MPELLKPAPLRKRLWQGSVALALIVITFTAGNQFVARDKALTAGALGHDFLAFYTAGTFAREGKFDLLYDLDSVRQFQRELASRNQLELGESIGPFWNPPFYAWLFAPLSALPYRAALVIWIAVNMMAAAWAILLLCRMLPAPADWKSWALVPLLLCVSMPFIQAITHAQNACISLLLMGLVVTAWRARADVVAGLLCGLLFYKPQVGAVVAIVLVMTRGVRVCLGLVCTVGSLLLVTASTMHGALGDYLHKLPQNLDFMQVQHTYLWERHVTLKAFWRLLLQGREIGETAILVHLLTGITAAMIVVGLFAAVINARRIETDNCWTGETRFRRGDRLIIASLCSMPLIMPFYFDYDLLLLSVAAVLLAGEFLSLSQGAKLHLSDRWLLGCWTALYLWLMVNPVLAGALGMNVSVILLASVAGLQIARACRRQDDGAWGRENLETIKVTARRAA